MATVVYLNLEFKISTTNKYLCRCTLHSFIVKINPLYNVWVRVWWLNPLIELAAQWIWLFSFFVMYFVCLPYSALCAMIFVCHASAADGRQYCRYSNCWCHWYFRIANYHRIISMCCSKCWTLMDTVRKRATVNNILNRAMESISNDFPDKYPVKMKIDTIRFTQRYAIQDRVQKWI